MAAPPTTANTRTFFITAITYNRRLFHVETNAKLFIETLQHYRAEGLYKLHAFVVMPDHVHLLLTTDDLAKAIQGIKGGFCTASARTFLSGSVALLTISSPTATTSKAAE